MLDKKTDAVLELLTNKCGNSYKVLDKKQIVSQLPSKLNIDSQGFAAIITFLKENEYVDVKYQDKDEICLCCTVKAESYTEGEKNMEQKAKITNGQVGVLWIGVFVMAFLGSLIAALIAKLF